MVSLTSENVSSTKYWTFTPARLAISAITSMAKPVGFPFSSVLYCGGHHRGTAATIVGRGFFGAAPAEALELPHVIADATKTCAQNPKSMPFDNRFMAPVLADNQLRRLRELARQRIDIG